MGGRPLRMISIGAVIGITAMLPGISGAVMAVLFGIYKRLIRDIADLRHYIREDFWFLALFLTGGVIGTVISAKLLNVAIDKFPGECMLFFVGLIAGQIPALYKLTETNQHDKPTSNNIAAFAAGIFIIATIMVLDVLNISGGEVELVHNLKGFTMMFLVGVIVAISALMPGISHATILIVLGLLSAFTAAIGNLEAFLLLPLVLGIVTGTLTFVKVIHYALNNHYCTMMFLILGLTIGSLAAVLFNTADKINGIYHLAASATMLVIGLILSVWLIKSSEKNAIDDTKEHVLS